MGHAGADALGLPPHPVAFFPQPSRNLDIAQNFFFPAHSSFYLRAGATEGARGPRSVVSITVGVSVWSPGCRWSEVRIPTSAPCPAPSTLPLELSRRTRSPRGSGGLSVTLDFMQIRAFKWRSDPGLLWRFRVETAFPL